MRAFIFSALVLLSLGPASATPSSEPDRIARHQALEVATQKAMAELLRRGPKQDGWNEGGIDIYKLVAAAPGGVARNYLVSIDKHGDRDVTIVNAGDSAAYVPASWKLALSEGVTDRPNGSAHLLVGPLDGPFYIVGWETERRVGDAFCTNPGLGARLFQSASGKPSEIPADMVPVMFSLAVRHLHKEHLCWRYDRQGNAFKVTYFFEDGSTAPTLNSFEELVSIVPAGDVEALLQHQESED